MDNGIEMVNPEKDVELDDFDEIPTTIPVYRGRRNCALCCTMSLFLGIAVLVVFMIYGDPDMFNSGAEVYTPDQGSFGNDVDGAKQAEQEGKLEDHIGPDAGEQFIENHGQKEQPQEDTVAQKIQKWKNAKVTLEDGVQYTVISQVAHASDAFTEGLTFNKGKLYESTGLNQKSTIRQVNPRTGEVVKSYPLKSSIFGEGLTAMKGNKLVQLTYKAREGYVYDIDNLPQIEKTFQFSTTTREGWGLTYDKLGDQLVVSDGSEFLHFWDPQNFTETHKVAVTRQNGKPATNINELEFWRNRILANVWFEDTILVIHPKTGVVEKEYGTLQSSTKEFEVDLTHIACRLSFSMAKTAAKPAPSSCWCSQWNLCGW